MPITNSIPDADRYARFEPITDTDRFPVGFVLFSGNAEEAKNEIEVKIDRLILDPDDYTIAGSFDLTTDYPVCTDAEVVLPEVVSGIVLEIEGARAPARVTQLPGGQGVPPQTWNVILNRLWAILRELYQRLQRVPMMPYGEAPPTPEEMLAWRDYVINPGTVISVNAKTGAVVLNKSDIGLGNTPNYAVASQAEAEAGGSSTTLMTPQRVAQAISALAPGVSLPPGFLHGLTISNNGSDAANDIDIAVGTARDSTNAADLALAVALTKRLDAAWVVGHNQGGLMGGLTKAINTWYHVFLIRRPDTGVVDVGFHTSATAPTLPAGYTQFRRLGSVRTDGSGAILGFIQVGDVFRWKTAIVDHAQSIWAGFATLQTLTVPTGVRVKALISALIYNTGNNTNFTTNVLFEPTDVPQGVPSISGPAMLGPVVAASGWASRMIGTFEVLTETSGQIRVVTSYSGGDSGWSLSTLGWMDTRGRS